jgi:hypothetical protein
MNHKSHPFKYIFLIGLAALASGCIIAPGPRYHDGYYDHEHERYWYGGNWHPCEERREYCR